MPNLTVSIVLQDGATPPQTIHGRLINADISPEMLDSILANFTATVRAAVKHAAKVNAKEYVGRATTDVAAFNRANPEFKIARCGSTYGADNPNQSKGRRPSTKRDGGR